MRSNPAAALFLLAAGVLLVVVIAFKNWIYTLILPGIMTIGFVFDVLFWPIAATLGIIVLYFAARRIFRF